MITTINEFRNYDSNIAPFGLDVATIVDRIENVGEEFEYQQVKSKRIIPPTKMPKGMMMSTQDLPKLLKYQDKYWIVPGSESKVAMKLATQSKFIDADVIDATHCDWVFNTPIKKQYSVKANENQENQPESTS